jgi:hypothetical protein
LIAVYLVNAKESGKCGKPGGRALRQNPSLATMEKLKYND